MKNLEPTTPPDHRGIGHLPNSPQAVGRLTLVEAAELVERLQNRAAHERELEALRIARDALLIIVSEGHTTLAERLRPGTEPAREPDRANRLAGGSTTSFRAAFSPHR